jgi:twitching motility protein PilT
MLRIDGSMRPFPDYPVLDAGAAAGILYEIMPERNRQQFEETHDTDFAYEIPELARFRCNVFMDRKGMGGVFRVIPSKILSCEQLGVPEAVRNLCYLTKGLVLVTGPTGSGKSTTLAAMMDLINDTRDDHVITIEDPIEFVHQNKRCLVNQREIGVHSKSFKAALKAALREDPDIVLVGEMRDLETIAIAIETAETGHLVFGTLHTTTAASTVDRIIDQFPTAQQNQVRMMLSESLKGVISQTLLKKKAGGRAAALEILIGASSVSNLIREGKTFQIPSVMQTSSNIGMQTLNDAIRFFVRKRLVEPLEAYMKAVDKAGMLEMLEEDGHKLDLAKLAENAKKKTETDDFWA